MRRLCILFMLLVITTVFAKEWSPKDKNRSKRINRGDRDDVTETTKMEINDDQEQYGKVELKSSEQTVEEGTPNPCAAQKCKRGEFCVYTDGNPRCVCQTCDSESRDEYKVCNTNNVTYNSECDLDRDHCLCKNKQPGCKDINKNKVQLDYYGECTEITECSKEELENFPSRMRDWLFRVMRELASRHELDEYLDLLENALSDNTHADAVIWKFCDLDIHPGDRKITQRELMSITASIKQKEHCLVAFLNSCDTNNDSEISLVEWGMCLGIGNDAIEDKCKQVHNLRG